MLIVSDRIELMKQSGGALSRLGIYPHEIKAGYDLRRMDCQVYTAMVETLARRMKDARYRRLVAGMDLIVFDEAHKQAFNKIFQYIPEGTVVIGATATPYRDGRQTSLREHYNEIIEVTDIRALITEGFLARPRSFGIEVDLSNICTTGGDYDEMDMTREYSRQRVFDGVVDAYKRITPGKKALAFAASIESSQELCQELNNAGINARHLDSNMSGYDRVRVLEWFRATPNAVLCNVGILTTGFDAPEVEVVILYRATQSLPLFLQMCGRGSRVIPGQKEEFFILDFGMNINRMGHFENARTWSLDKPKKRDKIGAPPVKECKKCHALLYASTMVCTECGYEFPRSQAEERQRVELVELTPRQWREMAAGKSLEEKAAMAKSGKIKALWVMHQLRDINEARKFANLMGWKWNGWWYYNKHRFPNLQKQEA